MRKYFLDHLRGLVIFLLFPVHTCMIWNDFGSGFYVWMGNNRLLSTVIVGINPWFMPLLFVIAGMSARYSLEKRTRQEFFCQRVRKLLVPLLAGIVFLVPFQTLFARMFFDGYSGGILENIGYFFTHLTDFSGYDGAFTPGHLWFLAFLFLISLVSLGIFRWIPASKIEYRISCLPVWVILLLFVPVWLMYYLGNFGGFSLGKDLALYLLGYYVLSNERVLDTLDRHLKWLMILWGILMSLLISFYLTVAYYGDAWVNLVGWISILALLSLARKYWNRNMWFTVYVQRASYPIYILHQSILVAVAYVVVRHLDGLLVQVLCIGWGSLALTVGAYQILRWVPSVRMLVGILPGSEQK